MRIRTVKPEFFLHEGLYDLEAETGLPVRLAFVGLWCASDREGRFQWSERRLKASIMPYDDVDFSRVLHALGTRGFLVKYRVGDEWFGVIPSFKRHQIVNFKERASDLPEMTQPEPLDALTTREARVDHALHKEGKGREGKGTVLQSSKVHQSLFRGSPASQPTEEGMSFEDLTAENPKAPRQRDECFEALAEIEGGHCGLTNSARGAVNKALKEIRQATPGVLPDEIRRRVRMYRMHFRDATVSACALAKHWGRCERMPEGVDPLKTAQGNPTHLSDLMKRVEAVCNQT